MVPPPGTPWTTHAQAATGAGTPATSGVLPRAPPPSPAAAPQLQLPQPQRRLTAPIVIAKRLAAAAVVPQGRAAAANLLSLLSAHGEQLGVGLGGAGADAPSQRPAGAAGGVGGRWMGVPETIVDAPHVDLGVRVRACAVQTNVRWLHAALAAAAGLGAAVDGRDSGAHRRAGTLATAGARLPRQPGFATPSELREKYADR